MKALHLLHSSPLPVVKSLQHLTCCGFHGLHLKPLKVFHVFFNPFLKMLFISGIRHTELHSLCQGLEWCTFRHPHLHLCECKDTWGAWSPWNRMENLCHVFGLSAIIVNQRSGILTFKSGVTRNDTVTLAKCILLTVLVYSLRSYNKSFDKMKSHVHMCGFWMSTCHSNCEFPSKRFRQNCPLHFFQMKNFCQFSSYSGITLSSCRVSHQTCATPSFWHPQC